jgi:hypothetical protein
MRNLLIVVLLLAVGVVGLGFYLDWFDLSTSRDEETGRTGVKLTIDQEKMKSDAKKARQKIAGGGKQATKQQGEQSGQGTNGER